MLKDTGIFRGWTFYLELESHFTNVTLTKQSCGDGGLSLQAGNQISNLHRLLG
jgi:hypothetical protein